MAGKGRQGVDYIKPKEPSFLAKFKREIGYKEGPTIDSKKAELHLDEDDHPETHDEQPLVVVLKEGDISKEEYEEHLKAKNGDDGAGNSAVSSSSTPGKISFKKPSKRTSGESPGVQFGSSKKKKDKSKQSNKNKKVKNESLLSFADDEEDET